MTANIPSSQINESSNTAPQFPNPLQIIEWILRLVLVALVLLGCAALVFILDSQFQSLKRQSKSIDLGDGQTLYIDYPAIVLADDQPAEICLALRAPEPAWSSIIVSLTIPAGLVLASPLEQTRANVAVVQLGLTASRVQTSTVSVLNARTTEWSFIPKRQILLQTSKGNQTDLSLEIEDTFHAAVRNVATGSITERSPLFVLATALLSALGLFYTQSKEQKDRLRAQEEENRKRTEEAKKTILENKNKFLKHLRNCAIDDARLVFTQFNEPLSVQCVGEETIRRMRELIELAELRFTDESIGTLISLYPNEAAGAILWVVDHNIPSRHLPALVGRIPLDRLEKELQKKFEDVRKKGQEQSPVSPVSREWPPQKMSPQSPAFMLEGTIAAQIYSDSDQVHYNPFPKENAEDEQPFMFAQGRRVFWADHSICKDLESTSDAAVIWGAPGSGKTACALALGEYSLEEKVFACYLDGTPTLDEIQTTFAGQLVQFIQHNPAWLAMGRDERSLLAKVCRQYRDKHLVLAELDFVPGQYGTWLQTAKNETQKNIWREYAWTELRMFRQAVADDRGESGIPDAQFATALIQCARSLGFERVRLVIDADGRGLVEWLRAIALPNAQKWARAGLQTTIFVPFDPGSVVQEDAIRIAVQELRWSNAELKQMLSSRFKHVVSNINLEGLFDEQATFDQTVEYAQGNPRCFMKLWNAIVALNPDRGIITLPIVHQAESQIVCP